jgi:hypothetical protein
MIIGALITISGSEFAVESVMVEANGTLKSMVDPAQLFACPIAHRSVPDEPSSAVLVTV